MRPAAALMIVLGNDGTLLGVSRPNDPQDFGLPGGSVELGEDPEVAAIRECREETSLVVTKAKLLDHSTYRDRHIHCFVALEWSGEPRRSDEGVVAWVTWETLGRGKYGDYNQRIAALFDGAK